MSWLPPSLQNWNPNAAKRSVAPPSNISRHQQPASLPSAHNNSVRGRQTNGNGSVAARSHSQVAYSSNSKQYPPSSAPRSSTVAPTYRHPSNPTRGPSTNHQQQQVCHHESYRSSAGYSQPFYNESSSLPPTQGASLAASSFSQGFSLRKKSLPPIPNPSSSRAVSQQQQPPLLLPKHLSALPTALDEETQLSLLASGLNDDETQDDEPPSAVCHPTTTTTSSTVTAVQIGLKRTRSEDVDTNRALSDLSDASEGEKSVVVEKSDVMLKSCLDTIDTMKLRVSELEKDLRTVTSAFMSCRTELDRERERTSDAALIALITKQVDVACSRAVPKMLTSSILFPKPAATTTTSSSLQAPKPAPVFKTVAKSICPDSDDDDGGAAF